MGEIVKYKADIAVVGGGAAGLAAAAAAAEKGRRVLLLEKNNACGGNGLFPMGMAAVGSYLQQSLNIRADVDEMFTASMAYSHWNADPRLNRVLLDRSGDTIRWLADMGVGFAAVTGHYPGQYPQVYHMVAPPENAGGAIVRALTARLGELGVQVLTNTRARKLLLDENGAVKGVLAETKDGGRVEAAAEKVVVATGGFAGNDALLRRLVPGYDPSDYLYIHGARPEGDGFLMMEEAGAKVDRNIAIAGGAPQIAAKRTAVSQLIARPYTLWLNTEGDRFADETVVYDLGLGVNAISRQPKKTCYVLLDADILGRVRAEGRDPLERASLPAGAEERLEEDYRKCVGEGYAAVTDSVGGIAAFMGLPAEKVAASIDEYNRFCDGGHDALFSKARALLMPVRKPPFYVIRAGVDQLFTWGGVVINHRFEVVGNDLEPIKGLYSAGNDSAGGIDGDTYFFGMSGHAFGYSVIGGRLAGEIAAGID